MEEAREKKYLEISLFSHDEITIDEIHRNSIVLKLLKISRDFGGSVSDI